MLKMRFNKVYIYSLFNKRPITLNGIPNFIKGLAMYLEIFGSFYQEKNQKLSKG